MAQSGAALRPLVDDPTLNALAKFTEFFRRINNWKAENREFLIEAMRVLY